MVLRQTRRAVDSACRDAGIGRASFDGRRSLRDGGDRLSQPQAGVILSLLAWHGIPAYGQNIETVSVNCPLALALGRIPIRVARECAEEARDMLSEAEKTGGQEEARSDMLAERVATVGFFGVFGLLGVAPPPRLGPEIVR